MHRLALAGLAYYRGVHAMVVLGVAVAVAVLAGALLVGASVRASLRELALARLGTTHLAVSAPQYFRAQLGGALGAQPLIVTTGAVIHDDSGRIAARVQVFGVSDTFMPFHGIAAPAPRDRDAWISEALAEELGAREGDSLLLRVAKPTDIPLGTLQGRRDEAGERIRLNVVRVAQRAMLGEFSLTPSQGPALALFVSLERLQTEFAMEGRVNALLTSVTASISPSELEARIAAEAELEDYGVRLRPARDARTLVVESRAGVMSEALAEAVTRAAAAVGATAEPVLVHLANTIRVGQREVPYSTVVGRTMKGNLALNEWAARDLDAREGDIVELEYFVWSDAAGLETRRAQFTLSGIVAMAGDGGDPSFTPDYPGLTDADNVSSWDPPFPVELRRVRPIDEDYWDEHRAAPKAFVPLGVAQELWATAHGNVSSVRISAAPDADSATFARDLTSALRQSMTPSVAGFAVRDARADALAAAEGTTDFGEYFVYFSFFLVVAGLLLAGLFFALAVEQRTREIGLLAAVGFRRGDIAKLLLTEALLLAALGSAIGIAGAVGYAALIMHGLRTWWRDAVGTSDLALYVDWVWLFGGAAGALVAAMLALALTLRAALARSPRALLGDDRERTSAVRPARRATARIATAGVIIAVGLVVASLVDAVPQVAGFFGAGAILMVAGLALLSVWLRRPANGTAQRSLAAFGWAYARWRPTRSVLSAALITFACFVIVSVGAFRRDGDASLDRQSGTGGFVLLAESVAPLMHNPNTAAGLDDFGLPLETPLDSMHVARFRLRPGDDASCLALYQPRNPRIVAPEPSFVAENRFRFAASLAATEEEHENPWLLLRRRFDDGALPAIADLTSLTYALHLSVGDDYLFTSDNGRPVRLRIVGALADSMLQSELIIAESDFIDLFPHREGYGMWLIDAPEPAASTITTVLEDRLSDFGLDVVDTRARLGAYHRVENTYLSTFQALGALGLLVGTLGLAAVLARNVLERRRELALLQAVGFTPRQLRTIVLAESILLVGAGLFLGTTTAVIAVVPALIERSTSVPAGPLALLLVAVTLTGTAAATLAAQLASRSSLVAALRGE